MSPDLQLFVNYFSIPQGMVTNCFNYAGIRGLTKASPICHGLDPAKFKMEKKVDGKENQFYLCQISGDFFF